MAQIPFRIIKDHVRRNSGIILPHTLGRTPWYYLSGFYYNSPNTIQTPGTATRALQTALASIGHPVTLCCEPILGTDPRSMTAKNEHLTSDERYEQLCQYYRTKFDMQASLPIDCTLRTELIGKGKRWSAERLFMWSLPESPFPPRRHPELATSDDSTEQYVRRYEALR